MLPPIPSLMVFFSQISIYAIGQLQLNLAGAAATDHRWPFPCDRFPLWPQAARLTLDSRIRQTGRKPRLAARHEWCQDAVSILPIVLEMQSNSFTSTISIFKMQNPFSSAEMQSEFSHQYWDVIWILSWVLRCSLRLWALLAVLRCSLNWIISSVLRCSLSSPSSAKMQSECSHHCCVNDTTHCSPS